MKVTVTFKIEIDSEFAYSISDEDIREWLGFELEGRSMLATNPIQRDISDDATILSVNINRQIL